LRFVHESQERVQTNVNCSYLNLVCNRWLSTRLELIGNVIVVFASLFAILAREDLSAGTAGLSISYAFNIIMSLNWMVITYSELEMNSVALERIIEYTENTEEAEWEKPADSTLPDNWPEKGSIQFDNYQTRYREGLDLVLKGVDMEVKGREKIGICGRTGAGKSSLTLTLFRIIEPAGGRIIIDGADISQLGLHKLRSRLTIIPQDPVLFTGDLRFNLDPAGLYSDQDLWNSLELAHLKDHVAKLPEGLDYEISEGGSNFSMGQRQLLCLARALLRKTKILILDEATASVDLETDDLIQMTIRKEFADCTVLTIAHRINTIMDSTRIAVLSEGKLEEMDSPAKLLTNPSSAFSSLVQKAGLS
jgi:ATP-binding cassette subfamily C (CFTR/MRP) protein 1